MRWFSFSLLISAGATLGHLYVYRRLVRHLRPRRLLFAGLAGLLVVMTALLLLRKPLRGLDGSVRYVYELVSYSWIALALGLLCATVVGDVLGLVHGAVGRLRARRRTTAPVPEADRRALVKSLPLGVLAGGCATAVYGSARAFAPAEISEVPVRLPGLPRTLDGLSIVQLTDIHVGNFIGRRFIERLVSQVNDTHPDVVAITGDLVDGNVQSLGHAVAALGGLRARYGTYFVTGNHEYYSGVGPWVRFLSSLGIHVLRNRHMAIGDGGGHFDLVGVDDWSGGRRGGQGYDLAAALGGRTRDRAAVLLSHQPRNFETAVEHGIGLQLSGHTHGGQVVPMTMLVGLPFPYNRGLYQHADAHIYVSRGCGFWGPPTRIGSAPEIVKVFLQA